MLTITFARHGQYISSNLSKEGIWQAQVLGEIIKTESSSKNMSVVSSPVQRAFQTSRIIANMLDVDVSSRRDLQLLTSSSINLDDEQKRVLVRPYRYKFQQLPKYTKDVVVVTHQPNAMGFSLAFADAVDGRYFEPRAGGAFSYKIKADHWTDAIACLEKGEGISVGIVHQCDERHIKIA